MLEINIRETSLKDCPVIFELIKELAQYEKLAHQVAADIKTLENSLFGANPKAFALLAEVDGNIAGLCLYFYNFSTFLGRPGIYIEDIFVKERYRKRGIGRRFFSRITEIAKAENCGRIEWWVLDWNRDAIDFYTTLGAEAMSEWTVYRITEDKFSALTAGKADPQKTRQTAAQDA